MLTPGRGLRRATYEEVAHEGSGDGFAIHATLDGPFGEVEVGTGTAGAPPEKPAGACVSTAPQPNRPKPCSNGLRVVWLTPAMDALFTGPAADRRRFLDRLVLTIDVATASGRLTMKRRCEAATACWRRSSARPAAG